MIKGTKQVWGTVKDSTYVKEILYISHLSTILYPSIVQNFKKCVSAYTKMLVQNWRKMNHFPTTGTSFVSFICTTIV